MLTLGGHYGKVKGGYFGNGGHYGPKRADIMAWADTLVGADILVHDRRNHVGTQELVFMLRPVKMVGLDA